MIDAIANMAGLMLLVVAFLAPSLIAQRRHVMGQGAILALNLMVVTWPWALALAFSPFTENDIDDQRR